MPLLEAELSLLDNNDTQSENAESLSGLSVLATGKGEKKQFFMKTYDLFARSSYS